MSPSVVPNVFFKSPEAVQRELRDQAIETLSGQELSDALHAIEGFNSGEYYQVLDAEEITDDGRQTTKVGALCIWVQDDPSDPQDPAGQYEVYDTEIHGDKYEAIYEETPLPDVPPDPEVPA